MAIYLNNEKEMKCTLTIPNNEMSIGFDVYNFYIIYRFKKNKYKL